MQDHIDPVNWSLRSTGNTGVNSINLPRFGVFPVWKMN